MPVQRISWQHALHFHGCAGHAWRGKHISGHSKRLKGQRS
jgi:hypothetical protein